ncbi:MAG: MFS transporter [Proteobacteria bacterium]|nr:MFS transporter [Pseudomonadota bacterium]
MAVATDAAAAQQPTSMGLVIAASSAGTVFEWYDFFIFGSLASIIAKHFFVGVSESQAYLFALLTFAAGFFVRPFGALFFGRFGDRIGRKSAFLVTITVMGLATFAVAFLPDYAAIGVAAPYALVAIRVLQGFAIGGEYGGAAIYVAEHASKRRRGLSTGWIQCAAGMGLFLALIVILGIRKMLGEAAFDDWGWRIPFAVSLFLLTISLWIRLRLNESPAFQRLRAAGEASKAPLSETFLRWENLKTVLLVLFAVLMGQGVVWYTAMFYTQFFLERVAQLDGATVNELVLTAIVASLPLYVFFAWLSDKIGRKPVMLFGLALAAISFLPGFKVLTEAVNPALASAAARSPVTVVAEQGDCSFQFDLIGKAQYVTSCDIAKSALASAGVPYSNETTSTAYAHVNVGGQDVPSPDGRTMNAADLKAAKANFAKRLKTALTTAGYPSSADVRAIDKNTALVVLIIFVLAATALYGPQAAHLVELFPTRIRYTALSFPYHIGVGWFGGFLPATAFAIVAATGDIYAGLWYPVIISGIGFFTALLFLPETKDREI